MVRLALTICLSGVFLFGTAAWAADDQLFSRFFGEYRGTGISGGGDQATPFGISVRSLDVTIEPAKKNGFKVRWSALIRGGDQANPKYRLKLAEATFAATDRAGVFKAVDSTIDEPGEWISWARVSGDEMTVYQLLLDEDGQFQLTSHERTLTDTGISLRFVRRQGSGVVRVVVGELERIAG